MSICLSWQIQNVHRFLQSNVSTRLTLPCEGPASVPQLICRIWLWVYHGDNCGVYVCIYINKFNGIWDIWSTLICGCVWTCWIHQFTAISIGNSTVFPWPNQRMHCKRIQLIPTNTAQSISRMLRFKDLRPIISKIHMYLHLHLHVFM